MIGKPAVSIFPFYSTGTQKGTVTLAVPIFGLHAELKATGEYQLATAVVMTRAKANGRRMWMDGLCFTLLHTNVLGK